MIAIASACAMQDSFSLDASVPTVITGLSAGQFYEILAAQAQEWTLALDGKGINNSFDPCGVTILDARIVIAQEVRHG